MFGLWLVAQQGHYKKQYEGLYLAITYLDTVFSNSVPLKKCSVSFQALVVPD